MNGIYLKLGTRNPAVYTQEQAHETIKRYCFDTVPLALHAPRTNVGNPLPGQQRYGWAYRTYDCVAADAGSRIGPTDIMVTTAINSRIGGAVILALTAAAPLLDHQIQAATNKNFWQLPPSDLIQPPNQGCLAWHLWRAWSVLMSVPGVDVAVTHKILHHKRPCFFPLLDRVTMAAFEDGMAWAGIHEDLTSQAAQFRELEEWFAQLAHREHGVALGRVRLHDILLWADRKSVRR